MLQNSCIIQGLYGFDSRGPLNFPSMRMHYWSNVLNILRDTVRAEVIVTSVPGLVIARLLICPPFYTFFSTGRAQSPLGRKSWISNCSTKHVAAASTFSPTRWVVSTAVISSPT